MGRRGIQHIHVASHGRQLERPARLEKQEEQRRQQAWQEGLLFFFHAAMRYVAAGTGAQ